MRFLHTSDWHLGRTDNERSLIDDQKFFIDRICELIAEERIDAVLLAGDVFDRSVASADAIRLYDYAVTRLCKECGAAVLIIAGNHDGADRLSNCSELLSAVGLHIAGALTREPQFVTFDDAQVFLLPWITEEKVKSVFPERQKEINSLTDAYRVAADAMRESFDSRKRHIVVSHAFISNTETSTSDRSAVIGLATQISADVFDGFDYVALGHIHKPQNVNAFIRYSGTPMPYSFGREETQEKSVTVVDAGTMEIKTVPLPLLHRRTTLTDTLEHLLQNPPDEPTRTGYVKLVVTDCSVGLETYSALKAIYPNVLECTGRSYGDDTGSVTITMEDFEKLESDPVEIFKYFCLDEMKEPPSEHILDLFRNAVAAVERGDQDEAHAS